MQILIVLMLFCVSMIPPAMAANMVGKIQLVSGESWVLKGDKSKVDAQRGMVIEASDTVVTGDRGRVKLMMLDGTHLFLSKNSRLEAKRYAVSNGNRVDEAKLDLFWGKVRFQVKHLAKGQGSFQMRTTTAVMGIRGTSGIFSSTMLPSDAKIRLSSQTLQSIPARPSQLVLTSGLVSMQSLLTGKMSLIRAGQTAVINARGALNVRPSRHRDLYIAPKPSVDDNKGSSPVMPPPPVEQGNRQAAAASQAKQTLHQQAGMATSDQKINTMVKSTGNKALQRSQVEAQVQVQQKINSTTSVVIVPTVAGP